MQDIAAWLTDPSLCLANPHSRHASGQFTSNAIEDIRQRILQHFHVSHTEYALVFTANATAALKLLAESYSFGCSTGKKDTRFLLTDQLPDASTKSILMMLRDSHTSLIGMRNMVDCEKVVVLQNFDCLQNLVQNDLPSRNKKVADNNSRKLFVLTAMSNFCGCKYDLRVVSRMQEDLGWSVCLDAAALAGCSQLNLQQAGLPHFVAISFYKMFGYPTGLGALLVHRDHAHLLHKTTYFGGGTVDFASDTSLFVQHRSQLETKFEDGTLDFYSIVSLEQRCFQLAHQAKKLSTRPKHANGCAVAVVYGWKNGNLASQGPIVNFNLIRDDGSWVGYVEVEKMADLFALEMRTGCFCNQGACAVHLRLKEQTLKQGLELGKVCGDELDLGTSTEDDIKVFQQMIECCFSCGAIEPTKWKLSATGLLYDRNWMIVSGGVPLTQKRFPVLCQIIPKIEEERCKLILQDRLGKLEKLKVGLAHVPAEKNKNNKTVDLEWSTAKVCTNRFDLLDYDHAKTNEWLSDLHPSLQNNDCHLVGKAVCNPPNPESPEPSRSFSNQGEYLLLTKASINAIAQQTGLPWKTVMRRFRPNLVIDVDILNGDDGDSVDLEPFQEDKFKELHVGNLIFEVTGLCTRCQMICIDQDTGEKDPNLLLSLRDLRKHSNDKTSSESKKLTFGVYLSLKKNAFQSSRISSS
uniref:MOSC domain-containing protein n=1 Tax=Ditylenchus dipsaci TaxID=166011 RepID=A0A915EPA3_9BILA